jgi:hypothetical protein
VELRMLGAQLFHARSVAQATMRSSSETYIPAPLRSSRHRRDVYAQSVAPVRGGAEQRRDQAAR